MKPKRIVSLFLTVVLLLSLAIPLQAASSGLSNFKKQTEYTGFSDVPETAWYAESVKTVCRYGLNEWQNSVNVFTVWKHDHCGSYRDWLPAS